MNINLLRSSLRFAALCLSISIVATASVAQPPTDYKKATAILPPDSQTVVNRLGSFRELPDGAWKMHSGDLPHGEDVELDDSSWPTVAYNSKAPNESVWFRQTYVVPDTLHGYDLTGARIWFEFHAGANGPMPEILYFNGRRVALGEDLEPIVLFDKVKPGDKVTVAVKLLHTVDQKTIRGASLRIDFPEGRPNPEDLREEFLGAAELIPSLDAAAASTNQATLYGAIAAVDIKALDDHNQKAFDASLVAAQTKLEALRPLLQQATFHLTGNSHIDAAWLWPSTETVDVVRRTFGTALQLMYEYPQYTYTQSAAAYNEWMAQKYPDMNDEIKRRINEGRWEVVGGMWVEPDLNMPDGESLVRQLLVGKRWYKQAYGVDVKIGWNPDSFGYTWQLPQIYKKSGVDYFVTQKMTWNDTNQLPFKLFWWESPDGSKVLSYFPHDYVNVTENPVRLSDDLALARQKATGLTDMLDLYGIGDHGGGPTRAILDEITHWTDLNKPGAACTVSGHARKENEGYGLQPVHSDSPQSPGALAPAGASGCAVTPKYESGTALPYFEKVEKQIAPDSPTWNYQSIAKGFTAPPAVEGKVSIPTWKSELYFEYHRGVFTTQANHKHNMRTAEEEVLNAEKWSSLAWLDGKNYPGTELTEDWKKVLFNQFHDLGAGSGIGIIYKDAQKDYDVVRWSTNEISSGAKDRVDERISTVGAGVPVVIYNPLGWVRSGDATITLQQSKPFRLGVRIEDEKGLGIPSETLSNDPNTGETKVRISARDIPALGYKVFRAVPEEPDTIGAFPTQVHDSDSSITLENAALSIRVDKQSGCITSLKSAGFETLAPNSCGNQLQFFKDTPKDYDAWNIDPGTLDISPVTIEKADSVAIVGPQDNPELRVTYHTEKSKFVQTISLKVNEVNISNDFDWHEKHVLLKAAFPLSATSNFATYEIPYGEIERPTTRDNSWEKAQFEVPAMRWADLSGAGADGKVHGLSVINKDKYGYDAAGNVLRLTLLRAPTWPDPDADQGEHHFEYALYPHAGTWKEALTVRHGWEYDYPLQAVVTTAHAGTLPPSHSFASVTPDNVVLTAVKKAEDANGLIFRVYEWAGKDATAEFHVPPGATSATVTNLMETPEGDPLPVSGDVVKVPIHPYEILTIRVDYAKAGNNQ